VEWVPLSEIPKLAAAGQIHDGPSLAGLSYYVAFERMLHEDALMARRQLRSTVRTSQPAES
jgi:hypothetical protein